MPNLDKEFSNLLTNSFSLRTLPWLTTKAPSDAILMMDLLLKLAIEPRFFFPFRPLRLDFTWLPTFATLELLRPVEMLLPLPSVFLLLLLERRDDERDLRLRLRRREPDLELLRLRRRRRRRPVDLEPLRLFRRRRLRPVDRLVLRLLGLLRVRRDARDLRRLPLRFPDRLRLRRFPDNTALICFVKCLINALLDILPTQLF